MMLTFGQMMLCPADTNEKIQADWLGFFGFHNDLEAFEAIAILYCYKLLSSLVSTTIEYALSTHLIIGIPFNTPHQALKPF